MIQRPDGAYLEQASSTQIPAGGGQAAGTSVGESFIQTRPRKVGAGESVRAMSVSRGSRCSTIVIYCQVDREPSDSRLHTFSTKPEIQSFAKSLVPYEKLHKHFSESQQTEEGGVYFCMRVSRSALGCQVTTRLGWVYSIGAVSDGHAHRLASRECDRHSLTRLCRLRHTAEERRITGVPQQLLPRGCQIHSESKCFRVSESPQELPV